MKKLIDLSCRAAAVILCGALVMAGCGKAPDTGSTPEPAAQVLEQPAAEPESAVKEPETAEASEPEVTEPAPEVSEPETTEPAEQEPEDEPWIEEEPEERIENNGGYFVRVDRNLYFRVGRAGAFPSTALWGEFLGSVPEETVSETSETQIVRMNLDTKQSEVIASDPGYGPIYTDGEGLYLSDYKDDKEYVTYLPFDGSEAFYVGDGRIVGASGDGAYVAVNRYELEPFTDILSIYQKDTCVSEFSTDASMSFAGMSGSNAYFMIMSYEWDKASYYQLGIGSEVTWLGDTRSFEYGYPNQQQFLAAADGVYFVCTALEGTAMMTSDVAILKAFPYEEGSLTELELPDRFVDTYGEKLVPELYLGVRGEVEMAQIAPGKALVGSEEEGGDLMVTYEPDEYTVIAGPMLDWYNDELGNPVGWRSQTAEIVDDAVFAIIARVIRDEESDIGWRESYHLIAMDYVMYDLPSGNETSLAHVEAARG